MKQDVPSSDFVTVQAHNAAADRGAQAAAGHTTTIDATISTSESVFAEL